MASRCFSTLRLPLFLALIIPLLSGCYYSNYYAFQKVEPQITMVDYKSIYLTQDDIVFVMAVRDNKLKEDGVWCAALALNDVVENTIPIKFTVDPTYQRYIIPTVDQFKVIKASDAISSDSYKIIKHDCSPDMIGNTNIPLTPIDIWSSIFHDRGKSQILVTTPSRHSSPYDCAYITLKSNDSDQEYKIAKAQKPIINLQYSKTRITLLPLLVVADVITLPWQVFMWINGPM
jgi:hypothetical protein